MGVRDVLAQMNQRIDDLRTDVNTRFRLLTWGIAIGFAAVLAVLGCPPGARRVMRVKAPFTSCPESAASPPAPPHRRRPNVPIRHVRGVWHKC